MNKTRHIVKNRHGLSMIVDFYSVENPVDLVFIQHGISGSKDQPHIQKMRDVFLENNFNVILFDATHSFGESDGALIEFTATTHLHDLEDLITWAATMDFYQEPFFLAGHSMGGFATTHYTIQNPKKIKALAPLSTGVSGKWLDESYGLADPFMYKTWQETGKRQKTSRDNPEKTGEISWNFIRDFCRYDLLPQAGQITVPVLLVVGSQDPTTPYAQQKIFYDALNCDKQLCVVPNADHSFTQPEERTEMAIYLDRWIKTIAKETP